MLPNKQTATAVKAKVPAKATAKAKEADCFLTSYKPQCVNLSEMHLQMRGVWTVDCASLSVLSFSLSASVFPFFPPSPATSILHFTNVEDSEH